MIGDFKNAVVRTGIVLRTGSYARQRSYSPRTSWFWRGRADCSRRYRRTRDHIIHMVMASVPRIHNRTRSRPAAGAGILETETPKSRIQSAEEAGTRSAMMSEAAKAPEAFWA